MNKIERLREKEYKQHLERMHEKELIFLANEAANVNYRCNEELKRRYNYEKEKHFRIVGYIVVGIIFLCGMFVGLII